MNLAEQPTTRPDAETIHRRRSRRVMIIGVGQVGMACAYSMVIQNTADQLILVDVNAAKLEGEVMDLSHGVPFGEPTHVIAGDLTTHHDADVVVITAGAKQQPGETRLNLVQRNAEIFRELVPQIMASCPHAIWVVVSNPVDVMTYVSLKLSGLPTERVLGSGTALDTARLRALLAQDHAVDARSVHAYIIGEHGDSEVPVWSTANIAGIPFKPRSQDEHQQLFEQVKTAAYEIIQRKGATSYAIGLGVNQIIQAILRDQRRVIPVSTQLDGYLNLRDVCLSLPAVLGLGGVERVLHLSLSATEQQQFRASAQVLQETIAQIRW